MFTRLIDREFEIVEHGGSKTAVLTSYHLLNVFLNARQMLGMYL